MKNTQTSESVFIGLTLAVSGGIMDVYSYLWRGKVFANAQTGNVLLFAINLANGNFYSAARYLLPIVAFVAGSFAIPFMRQKTILLCCGLLTVVFITMFIKTKENNLKGDIQP